MSGNVVVFFTEVQRGAGWLFRSVRSNAEFRWSEDFSESSAIGPCYVLKKIISGVFVRNVKKSRTNKPFRLTVKAINCSRV